MPSTHTCREATRRFLSVDIGNSRAKLTLLSEELHPTCIYPSEAGEKDMAASVHSDPYRTAGLPEAALRAARGARPDMAAICCVGCSDEIAEIIRRQLSEEAGLDIDRIHILDPYTRLPLDTGSYPRLTLGADRIAAACGAVDYAISYNARNDKKLRYILIVDAGTAITHDVVEMPDGQDTLPRLMGGNISAGLRLRLDALHEATSRLPRLTPTEAMLQAREADSQSPFIGHDTRQALACGALRGAQSETALIASAYLNKDADADTLIIFTGGDARLLEEGFGNVVRTMSGPEASLRTNTITLRHLLAQGLKYIFAK